MSFAAFQKRAYVFGGRRTDHHGNRNQETRAETFNPREMRVRQLHLHR